MTLLDVCNAINDNLSDIDLDVFYNHMLPRDYYGYMYLSQPALIFVQDLNLFYFGHADLEITQLGERLIEYIKQVRSLC